MLNTPREQLFWHLSVAIHHLTKALDLDETDGVLTPDEARALHAAGDVICAVMNRMADEHEDVDA